MPYQQSRPFLPSLPLTGPYWVWQRAETGENRPFSVSEKAASAGRSGLERTAAAAASFEEAAAGKTMCHSIYLFITIDRL
jgi:hypothetical protein